MGPPAMGFDGGGPVVVSRISLGGERGDAGDPPVPEGWRGAEAVRLLDEVGVAVGVVEVDDEGGCDPFDNCNCRELSNSVREGIVLHNVGEFCKKKNVKD